MKKRSILIIAVVVFLFGHNAIAQPSLFWSGVMFFGMNEPTTTKSTFYATLRDSLKLNLYQVATNGGAYLRHDFFLNNGIPNDLKVLVLEDSLAGFSSVTGLQKDILLGGGYDAVIHRNVDSMLVHGGLSILRFYLRDEPTIDMNLAWNYVQGRIRVFSSGLGSLAAFADTGIHINHFVNGAQPSELIIDPYFLHNCMPLPSLQGNVLASDNAGIAPWDYGLYFGLLQQFLNQALRERIRPAAEDAKLEGIPLVIVAQLHGVIHKSTLRYDDDYNYNTGNCLRPPSPSEIRLQYNIAIAYGAKGLLGYPYSTDVGLWDSPDSTAFPGLVSRDASMLDHSSNYGMIFGKSIWTGYKEKWEELANLNSRLRRNHLEDTLLALHWIGAKSWTMKDVTWLPDSFQTTSWEGLVRECSATSQSAYKNNLPQVEVGHLRRAGGSSEYIVIVNRRCANSDTTAIRAWLKDSCIVTNIETNKQWLVAHGGSFQDTLPPGGGGIYRIDPLSYLSDGETFCPYLYVPGKTYDVERGSTFSFPANGSPVCTRYVSSLKQASLVRSNEWKG